MAHVHCTLFVVCIAADGAVRQRSVPDIEVVGSVVHDAVVVAVWRNISVGERQARLITEAVGAAMSESRASFVRNVVVGAVALMVKLSLRPATFTYIIVLFGGLRKAMSTCCILVFFSEITKSR